MAIVAVPQLNDNYAYLVIDDASKQCGVVDCSEAAELLGWKPQRTSVIDWIEHDMMSPERTSSAA